MKRFWGRRKKSMTIGKTMGPIRVFGRSLGVALLCVVGIGLIGGAFQEGGEMLRVALIGVIGIVLLYGLGWITAGAFSSAIQASKAKRLFRECESEDVATVLQRREGKGGAMLRVVRGLHHQFRIDPNSADAETLVGIMHARLMEPAKRAEHCAEISVQCGVLGTVSGLMLMLPGMAKAVADAEGKGGPDLMVAMFKSGGPLGDLGSAFSTTMAGIAACAVLTCFAVAHRRTVNQMCSGYLELITVYVVPAFRRAAKSTESTSHEESEFIGTGKSKRSEHNGEHSQRPANGRIGAGSADPDGGAGAHRGA